ncbi:MAG: hypothetical protein AAF985_04125 [Bacteroidota bacterium]
MLKSICTVFICLWLCASSNAQSGAGRDALRFGYNQVYLGQEGLFKPGAYIEYARLFYEPLHLGVMLGFTQAKGIVTSQEERDLTSFHFDLNVQYAFLDDKQNSLKLLFGFSARLFETQWLELSTEQTGTDTFLRPGIAFGINYDYVFDPFFIGFRAMGQAYSNNGAVYLLGGHLGFRF